MRPSTAIPSFSRPAFAVNQYDFSIERIKIGVARLLGSQLLQINVERFGWRPELIDRLTRYQNDTELIVANEAHWIIQPAITENPPA